MQKKIRSTKTGEIIFIAGIFILTPFLGAVVMMILTRANFFDYILLATLVIALYGSYLLFIKIEKIKKLPTKTFAKIIISQDKEEASQQ